MRRQCTATGIIGTMLTICLLLAGCGQVCGEDRAEWQPPQQILDAIGVEPGMVIGDAGAGTGYLSFPLARRVGPTGKVYANEIAAGKLEKITERAKEEEIGNIETVLGEVDDPRFPRRDLDMIIMVYVLHHLEQPLVFLQNVEGYLQPGAPLVIIERNSDVDREDDDHHSWMSKQQIGNILEQAGYQITRTETFLPKDTIYLCHPIDRS